MKAGAIITRDLTRRFDKSIAVDRLNLDVEAGQIFGFLGPNGAGKTTTIRMLTGILRSSSGTGRVLGYDLATEAEAVKRNIGYVAQHFGLYDELTVAENLNFYARVYGRLDHTVTANLLSRYGFDSYRDTLAKNLSGGFRQRLALICALTHSPKLLFLDEPTAGVDPGVRKQLWDLFYELAADGTTLFVTTHYMEEAERCDRLAIIHRGRLIADDTPAGMKQLLTDREVIVVHHPYDPRVIARAKSAENVDMVNQFGATLRLVTQKGSYDVRSIIGELGLDPSLDTRVAFDAPTIEDVFVMMTRTAPEDV